MHAFPHLYTTSAQSGATTEITLTSPGLPPLATDAPAEFDGPGDKWSPETMLVGAVANCFILTFRAIARASHFEYSSLACDVEGKLDRPEKKTRFTEIRIRARLGIPSGGDAEKAKRLLQKAEETCLITNSLNAEMVIASEITGG